MVDKQSQEQELKDIGIPDPDKRTEWFYGKGGTISENTEGFAKAVKVADYTTYYVKYGRGDIFDPFGIDREKANRSYYEFRRVTKDIFDHYISYLTTEKRIFLTRAKRKMMEV